MLPAKGREVSSLRISQESLILGGCEMRHGYVIPSVRTYLAAACLRDLRVAPLHEMVKSV